MPMPRSATRRRLVACTVAATALLGALPLDAGAYIPGEVVEQGPVIDAPDFPEVGRVTVPTADVEGETPDPAGSGHLILDPSARRGYTVTEGTQSTVIESFDLDSLRPRRQVVVPGYPVTGGASADNAAWAGEVIHAVDEVAGRIYLAFGPKAILGDLHTDGKRTPTYFLVIDEEAFDRDPRQGMGTFTFPATQRHLQGYLLMGLTVTHHHTSGPVGKLLGLFAARYDVTGLPVTNTPIPGVFDHTLVQWDVTGVELTGPPTRTAGIPGSDVNAPAAKPVPADWLYVPRGCATSSLSAGAGAGVTVGLKNYEWHVLALPDALAFACQSAPLSAAVVRIGLDGNGAPVADAELIAALGQPVSDVAVDEGSGRLFLRSVSDLGSTWWAFDVASMRFSGAIAGTAVAGGLMASGVDSATGRLYTLTPDECVSRAGGGLGQNEELAVRGGLRVTEARLDPIPAARSVLPELAYPSLWSIRVDPVRRRVFLRRGQRNNTTSQYRYPECDQEKRIPAPVESFWRVYEDRIPLPSERAALDDAAFTTNVEESPGRTEASFLGSGSGYGARSLLVGGIDALAHGIPTHLRSLCGRDNREVLAGSVGKVDVSDQGMVAEAASLDADSLTREVLGDPLSRCRPQSGDKQLDRCHGDVREGAFDQARPGVDENDDGCTDRDGVNRYAARCLDGGEHAAPGFDDAEHHEQVPRQGFKATVTCDDEHELAKGASAASFEQASPQGGDPVRVARSASTVTSSRKPGKGVTVSVDSIARGVEIAGVGTIGVVRAEATSTSSGRDGGARATFTRTICDVELRGLVFSGCMNDERQQQSMVDQINGILAGRATVRLRRPDPTLANGTPHGYLAGIQRHRNDLFADQSINRDASLAVPALELVFYQGDGGEWGAGRQIVQLAAVQATTSYGVTCTYGKRIDGSCAKAGEVSNADAGSSASGLSGAGADTILPLDGAAGTTSAAPAKEGLLTRLLRALPRAVAEAIRLLFNNPRELGLLAALWALLYAPCYLADRRRSIRQVAALRLADTG